MRFAPNDRRRRSNRCATSASTFLRLSLLAVGLLCTIQIGGCGVVFSGPPAGAFLGNAGLYNYSPTALQIGSDQQFWWCGEGHNPQKPSQLSDTIQYASFSLATGVKSRPRTVLAETPGAWDSVYTCNPKVVGGEFTNPLGNGQNYSYAMYYVGTNQTDGDRNSIGVAFSNDGIHWNKYPQPVIAPTTPVGYGVGQPAVYNSNNKSGIWIFYENSTTSLSHVKAVSTDGIHFSTVGTLTTNGLDPSIAQSWGDMAYDSGTGYWYAAFNWPIRNPSTTGGYAERGQMGIVLYRIPNDSLLSGSTPWQMLGSFDTNLLGNESVFLAGFLRNKYGGLSIGPGRDIQMYTSISDPPPPWNASPYEAGISGNIGQWDIGRIHWAPNSHPMALKEYFNSSVHEVTTGWVDPNGNFKLESTLGHLYPSPQNGATLAFYGCKAGALGYFLSIHRACGGKRILGLDGYGYSQPPPGLTVVPLYGCTAGADHFIALSSSCGGQASRGQLLGYALP